ncbi:MAG TPA: hypothetical protein PLO14_15355, partial [Accumulibacter sp.]|nr:hypothetical protein [Accumulibacter sp.]
MPDLIGLAHQVLTFAGGNFSLTLDRFVRPLPFGVDRLLVSVTFGKEFHLVITSLTLQGVGKPGAIFAHLADLFVTGPKEGGGIGQALPQVFDLGLVCLESRLKGLPLSLQRKGFALELGSAFLGLRHR